ncbi:hypothetical protein ACJX0J_009185, partial [Zea mays]
MGIVVVYNKIENSVLLNMNFRILNLLGVTNWSSIHLEYHNIKMTTLKLNVPHVLVQHAHAYNKRNKRINRKEFFLQKTTSTQQSGKTSRLVSSEWNWEVMNQFLLIWAVGSILGITLNQWIWMTLIYLSGITV